jgi:tRNA U34 5-methylaminomethyl-2-thiouridine-forming methyltransferase MnmC
MNLLIETADGSHTIHSEAFNASYHSTHGSIQETKTVFIDAGLNYFINKGFEKINILEIGFGTGLNAFMTYLEAKNSPVNIHYDSFELYPIGAEIASKLNYPECLGAESEKDFFLSLHKNPGSFISVELSDKHHFNFYLFIDNFEHHSFNSSYDLIYFDAFAPSIQPQLWQESFLQKMYNTLSENGILVTYCAQGAFKRALKSVGFKVEALPGPIGKREMTRVHKKITL